MENIIEKIVCPELEHSVNEGQNAHVIVRFEECSSGISPTGIMCPEYNTATDKCERRDLPCIYSEFKNFPQK